MTAMKWMDRLSMTVVAGIMIVGLPFGVITAIAQSI